MYFVIASIYITIIIYFKLAKNNADGNIIM